MSSTARGSGPRIGFLIDRWEPARGGGEAATAAFAAHLAARGAEVVVVAERADERELPSGASWHRVRARGLGRTRREAHLARALVDAARDAQCELTVGSRHLPAVDLYWPHGGSYRASLAARRRSRGRAPERSPRGRHRLFLDLERELLEGRGARRVVCVSELVRRELAAEYPSAAPRLVTIANGVDLERFHPRERLGAEGRGRALRRELGLDEAVPLILFSAREPRLKGLPQLLGALAELRGTPFRLLVAGPRRPSPWRALARAHGLERCTTFVRDADPAALASAADLCALPTWRDSSSLVVLECLASGTPVVTTARAGAADAVASDVAGTVVPEPDDAEGLREAIGARLSEHREGGPVERERVREHVLDRGLESWLAALARELEALRTAAGREAGEG